MTHLGQQHALVDATRDGSIAPIFGRSPDGNGTARPDAQETFLAIPGDRPVDQKAVIRVRLLDMPTAASRQLIEQPLRFLQVGRIEALSEPTVDGGEQIMSPVRRPFSPHSKARLVAARNS